MQINISENHEELAQELSQTFIKWATQSIKSKGIFFVALPGGNTPKPFFSELAKNYKNAIPWDKVHFFWSDERCVPAVHPDSNFKTAKSQLLDFLDIPEENIHRIKGENDEIIEVKRYSEEIINFVPTHDGQPVFDLIMLGMGEDGHTASIFPGQKNLLHSPKICDISEFPKSGQRRITFTGSVINNALRVVIIVTGSSKAKRISDIINKAPGVKNLPAFHINPIHGELIWWLDEDAAAYIENTEL
jgi:6-phosphogluconolactonase